MDGGNQRHVPTAISSGWTRIPIIHQAGSALAPACRDMERIFATCGVHNTLECNRVYYTSVKWCIWPLLLMFQDCTSTWMWCNLKVKIFWGVTLNQWVNKCFGRTLWLQSQGLRLFVIENGYGSILINLGRCSASDTALPRTRPEHAATPLPEEPQVSHGVIYKESPPISLLQWTFRLAYSQEKNTDAVNSLRD
jgi:hypothetical protein